MSMRAFTPYGAEPPLPGATIELDDEESHYLVKVRRARIGETLELFDGRGGAWAATLRTIGRRARVEVGVPLNVPEPVPRVVLLGLPDQPATLEALTGASELGATHVLLVACERSNGRVPSATRTQRILRASQRQCGRPRPLEVIGGALDEPLALTRALELYRELPGVFAWEALRTSEQSVHSTDHSLSGLDSGTVAGPAPRRGKATSGTPHPLPAPDGALVFSVTDHHRGEATSGTPHPLPVPHGASVVSVTDQRREATEQASGLRLLVGPEGGLTPPEVDQLRAAGFRAVSLGPWVLRTPTAVIAMLARFQGF